MLIILKAEYELFITTPNLAMADGVDSGLFNISLSDSEDSSSQPKAEAQSRADKTAQSEADFQGIKASYYPKVENREVSAYGGRSPPRNLVFIHDW